MSRNYLSALLFPMLVLAGAPAPAQTTITGEQATAIIEELKAIRKLLERGVPPQAEPEPAMPQMPPTAKVTIGDAHILGKADAPITIVEYTDSQCGFCKRFHNIAFAEIRQKLIDTGKVRFVSRDFPLDYGSISVPAAEAMRCAGEQGKYWPLRDSIMSQMAPLTPEGINELAKQNGVDVAKMNACVESRKYRPAIENDVKEGVGLNVRGTPAFVIGRTTKEGADGVTLMGALGYEAFLAKIKEVEDRK
jgi:protein-disulfide isomerase